MGKKGIKYYAVRKGRIPGIYMNWNECQKQINKFSSPEFNSFNSLSEAEKYMKNNVQINISGNNGTNAYISGSFNKYNNIYGYAGLIIHNDTRHIIKGKGNDINLIQLGSVSSQITASKEIIKKAIGLNIKNLNIYYDYDGVEKWATGEWKRNKEETKKYYDFIQDMKSKINIKFIKNNKEFSKERSEVMNLAKEEAGNKIIEEEESSPHINNIFENRKNIIQDKIIKKRIIRRSNNYRKFELKKLPDYIKAIFLND